MEFKNILFKYVIKVSFKIYEELDLNILDTSLSKIFNEPELQIKTSLADNKVFCEISFENNSEYENEFIEEKIENVIYEELDLTNYYNLSFSKTIV
ncbi:hypothetical protein SAMN02745174_01430 [Cetobacterium ceti]|uniref:Uncharacterized protein n=1 Tax=Cetobacterium ceti TaxID=180163 RepID=A0A1T4N692_9FUSO|nr:hypothetical protein [Cetobacterium ceti]SJZ74557.1 hypothetical protein SAMN02745174_01430 [Cetobacterium ceti]